MKKILAGLTILMTGFVFTADAYADKILMQNGDQVRGTVEKVEDGVLTFTTKYSESIRLKTSQIKKILTEKPVSIHLTSGEILKGRILPAGTGQIRVEAFSGRGTARINWDIVKAINPPPNQWKGSIALGGSIDQGNTERTSGSLGFDAKRIFEEDRIAFKFLSIYSEEDESVSTRNTYGTAKVSHDFTDQWFSFLAVEMLSDTFKDLDLRTTIGPGVGYRIWEDEKKSLEVEGGFTYTFEDRRTAEDEQYASARFAGNFSYNLISNLTFANEVVIFPSLENSGEYTLRNEASLITILGNGWNVKLTNVLERDNAPAPEVEEDDLHWIAALGYKF